MFGINTWIWSIIFHTRDLPWSEKGDYFSAAAGVLYSVFYSIIRIFHIRQRRKRVAIGLMILLFFICHVSYLSFWKFDYGYNMVFVVTSGLVFNALWVSWAIPRIKAGRAYAKMPVIWAILMTLALSLELFDFAPWFGVLDAHALWHLATIRIIGMWYEFLLEDARWDARMRLNYNIAPGKKS